MIKRERLTPAFERSLDPPYSPEDFNRPRPPKHADGAKAGASLPRPHHAAGAQRDGKRAHSGQHPLGDRLGPAWIAGRAGAAPSHRGGKASGAAARGGRGKTAAPPGPLAPRTTAEGLGR